MYTGLVVGETLITLLVIVVLVTELSRWLAPRLGRGIALPRPIQALAGFVLMAGLFLFVYWAGVDVLSGYNQFPDYAFRSYPLTHEVFVDLGLGWAPIPDKYRVIGVASFACATVGFFVLRARRGLGVAIRDTVGLFAAPLVMGFELALWYAAPAEMFWHATSLIPWSLGKYINADQFAVVTNSKGIFDWGGNIYAVSNWFALAASCGLLGLGLAYRLLPRLLMRGTDAS